MLLNLYDVLSVVGKEKTVKAVFTEQEVSYFGETIKVSAKDEFQVTLRHTEKEIVSIALSLDVKVVRACSRCLEDVENTYQLDINRKVNVEKGEAYTDNEEESDEIGFEAAIEENKIKNNKESQSENLMESDISIRTIITNEIAAPVFKAPVTN